MTRYEILTVELLSDPDTFKSIGGVFGVLDKLPNPSGLGIGVFIELSELRVQLLS